VKWVAAVRGTEKNSFVLINPFRVSFQ